MHYLIIDTCVWIDLCNNNNNKEIREKLSNLVNRKKVKLIIPQLVIVEWERNKQSKIIDRRVTSIGGMIKNAKNILEYLPQEESSYIKGILEIFPKEKIIQQVLEEIKAIEYLFNHPSTIKLEIEENVKLQAVEFALEKKAPFKEKNSMADALILLSAIDYIRKKKLTNCIFVSTNTKDFGSNSETKGIHEDLKELFDEYGIKYFLNIGLAINEIEKDLVSAEKIRAIELDLQTKRQLERLCKSLAEILNPKPFDITNGTAIGSILNLQSQLESIGKSVTESLNTQLFGGVNEKAIKDFINTQSQLNEIAKATGSLDIQSKLSEIFKAAGSLDIQSKLSEISKAACIFDTQSQLSEIFKAAGILDAQSQLSEIAKATGILDIQSKLSEISKAAGIFDTQSQLSEIAKTTGLLDNQRQLSEFVQSSRLFDNHHQLTDFAKSSGLYYNHPQLTEIAKLTDMYRIFDLYRQLEKIPIPPTIRSCITKNLTRSMKVSARRTKITPCRTKISLIRSQKTKIWSRRMNISSHITKISRRTRSMKRSLRWTKILPRRPRRTKNSLVRMRTSFYVRKSRRAFIKRKRD